MAFVSTIFHQHEARERGRERNTRTETKTKPLIELILTCATACVSVDMGMFAYSFFACNFCVSIFFLCVRFLSEATGALLCAHTHTHTRSHTPKTGPVDFHSCNYAQVENYVYTYFFSAALAVVVEMIVHSAKLCVFTIKHDRVFFRWCCCRVWILFADKRKIILTIMRSTYTTHIHSPFTIHSHLYIYLYM